MRLDRCPIFEENAAIHEAYGATLDHLRRWPQLARPVIARVARRALSEEVTRDLARIAFEVDREQAVALASRLPNTVAATVVVRQVCKHPRLGDTDLLLRRLRVVTEVKERFDIVLTLTNLGTMPEATRRALCDSPQAAVRILASFDSARRGSRLMRLALERAARTEPKAIHRASAIHCLARLEDPTASLDLYLSALADHEQVPTYPYGRCYPVFEQALFAIGCVGDPSVLRRVLCAYLDAPPGWFDDVEAAALATLDVLADEAQSGASSLSARRRALAAKAPEVSEFYALSLDR
ncbi:MAG: hypothetical protein U0271_45275 [Polyangiaceae bacterium]